MRSEERVNVDKELAVVCWLTQPFSGKELQKRQAMSLRSDIKKHEDAEVYQPDKPISRYFSRSLMRHPMLGVMP